MLENVFNDVWPYVLLGLPIVLTGMGLPVPEEFLVIGAGIASHKGTFEPLADLLTCIVAAMMGDCVSYAIGYHFGHGLLREHRWFARFLNPRTERKMEQKIRQHGLTALLVTRFLVGVRSPVYVAAGVLRVPFRYFIVCDLISASLVVSLFFGLSYLFAEQILNLWQRIQKAEIALTVVIVSSVLGIVLYFYVRHRRRVARIRLRRLRRKRSSAAGSGPPPEAGAHGQVGGHIESNSTEGATKSVA
ncbi:MAG TPA: DedA family protein [Pirellulales bacterium]|nr:DedA family protein [Pirellulales bacterium]